MTDRHIEVLIRTPDHPVHPGSIAACSLPEFPRVDDNPIDFRAAHQCRACLVALVALAVNRPNIVGTGHNGRPICAPESALLAVRESLDEIDPLRVRAEQELVPLVARYAA